MATLFGRSKDDRIEKYAQGLLDTFDEAVLITQGKDCRVLTANESAQRLITSVGNERVSCRKHFCPAFLDLCELCVGGDGDGGRQSSFEVKGVTGGIYEAVAKRVPWPGGSDATVLRLREVTQARADREQLYKLAFEDQLTHVPNRQRLRADFDKLAGDIAANKLAGALALFDLDFFKAVNDTYGHNSGDIMLTRLAEYFKEHPDFKDAIYRLGGDEFVLLFKEQGSRFESTAQQGEHYSKLLQSALRSFTIPNIDITCTLSMGVSLFPVHGTGFSELLRKADIALYEAKSAGRNRLTLFEDRYDNAKKFKDLFINIQPVLTAASKTFGYELNDQSLQEEDDSTINLTEFNRTLDALGLDDVGQGVRYFITYTNQLFAPPVLINLPRDLFVVQVPYPTITGRELAAIKRLKEAGYRIVMTGVKSTACTPENLALADYVRFADGDNNRSMQKQVIAKVPGTVFIARGVDDPQSFEQAKQYGFKLFQGYHFSHQPTVQKTKEIDPLKVNYYRLIQLTSKDGHVDFREISEIISSDVALSYKLLRLLNSAAVGLRNVSSIQMAVAYLGEEGLKRWIGLLALRGIGEDKPLELIRMSLIRARMGELLCPYLRMRGKAQPVFLTGMLSLLHVALETTREVLMEDIPVGEDIRDSLLTKMGPYSGLLAFFEQYEYGNWDEVSRFCREYQLTSQQVNDCYISAVKWYNDLQTNQK